MASNAPVTCVAIVGSHEMQVAVTEAAAAIQALVMHTEVAQPSQVLSRLSPRAEAADILLLDLAVDGQTETALGELLTRRPPDAPVIVSSAALGVNEVRRLHRHGVFDVVPQPAGEDDLRETLSAAVRQIIHQRRSAAGLAPVIAFTRAKGGMGATTLATHATLSLAGAGRRKAPQRKVGFIDLDIQFGDASINLDISGSGTLIDLIEQPNRLDGALLRNTMVERPEGFSMLGAPRDLLPFEALEPEVAGTLIDAARAEFDVVVLDLPMAIISWTRAVLERVHELVIVTGLSVSGIRRSRRLCDLLGQQPIGTMHTSLALNRFNNNFGEQKILRQSEKTLGRQFDFQIANDYALVARSQDQGVSMFKLKPGARLVRDIHTMSDQCLSNALGKMAEADVPDDLPQAAE